jgi:hypothetical protein
MADNESIKKHFNIPIEKHESAAWANIRKLKPLSNVTVPDEMEIRNAKEWVDTNQK